MLMRNERLAALRTEFDDATETLTIFRDGKQVARGALGTKLGRQIIEQFFAGYMRAELKGAPRIVSAAGHSFSDVAAKCLHFVNLATVREVEGVVGKPLDPLRFRANVYFDGRGAVGGAEMDRPHAANRRGASARVQGNRALRRHQRQPGNRRARHRHPANASAHL